MRKQARGSRFIASQIILIYHTFSIYIMAQTIASNKIMNRIVVHGDIQEIQAVYVDELKTNGTDIKAGDCIRREGDPDVDLHTGAEPFGGIVLDYNDPAQYKASYSLGVTIPDNTDIKVLRRTGGRVTVQVVLHRTTTTTVAVVVGDPIYVAFTAAGAGKVSNIPPTTLGLDAARHVGYAAQAVAASVTVDQVILVRY
jgi:hypothetical protein